LDVAIWDKDPNKSDFLGSIRVPLSSYMKEGLNHHDEWLPLRPPRGSTDAGAVHLRIQYKPRHLIRKYREPEYLRPRDSHQPTQEQPRYSEPRYY
jgi:hypothetical protein